MSLQVSGTVSAALFPVFPVGSLIYATIELPIPLRVHDFPAGTDVAYQYFPILSLHRRM